MSRNTIQFQKGMSLHDFINQYGAEEQCRKALQDWRWPDGFVCPECSCTKFCVLGNGRWQCNECRSQTSLTAGTLFAGTKLPLKTWFLAMYLITQSKSGISALSLKRQIGVSYNTAWLVKHKLMQAMKERDDSKKLNGDVQVDDVYIGGQSHDGSRGRAATGKVPVIAAVQCNHKGQAVRMRFTVVKGFRKNTTQLWAEKHLAEGSIVYSDGLNCFQAVKDAGCFHIPSVTGGGFKAAQMVQFQAINTMIGNVKNSISGTYHSMCILHAPRYLAEFCYRFNRRFDLAAMIPRLGYIAARTPPFPLRLAKLAEPRG